MRSPTVCSSVPLSVTEESEGAPTASAGAEQALLALQKEFASLQKEHLALQQEYAQKQEQVRQKEEFCRLYPEIVWEELPKELLEQKDLPLAAAYALYERKRHQAQQKAKAHNFCNTQKSSGSAQNDGGTQQEYSLEQIRRMSQGEVRKHYASILRSLKK